MDNNTMDNENLTNEQEDDKSWIKRRRLRTVTLYWAFAMVGICVSVYGPSLLSLETLLDTNTKGVAAGLTGGSVGYTVGSVLCGLIYAMSNKELIFVITLTLCALTQAIISYSGHVGVFFALMVVLGLTLGIFDTAGQSYLLRLWQGHKYRQTLMQGMHCVWSLGSTIGPFIMKPLLKDSEVTSSAISHVYNFTETQPYNNTYLLSSIGSVTTNTMSSSNSQDIGVQVGFLITAGLTLISSINFFIVFLLLGPSCKDPETPSSNANTPDAPKKKRSGMDFTRSFVPKLLAITFWFYFFLRWTEGSPGNFIAVYVVHELGFNYQLGSVIASTYWGAHTFGRMMGVPVSRWLTPKEMVISDLVIATCGFLLLTISNFHHAMPWIGISLAGFGIGTMFASSILWMEEYVEISGRVASVLVTAGAMGGIISPIFIASFMDHFGDSVLPYILLSAIFTQIFIFGIALYFVHKSGTKRY